jgi:hypothetical protein
MSTTTTQTNGLKSAAPWQPELSTSAETTPSTQHDFALQQICIFRSALFRSFLIEFNFKMKSILRPLLLNTDRHGTFSFFEG